MAPDSGTGLDLSAVRQIDCEHGDVAQLAHHLYLKRGLTGLTKELYNVALLTVLMAVLVPLFCILMGLEIQLLGWFLLVLLLGGYALAVTTTIIAAIIARAMTRGALFSVLALPLLLPLLIFVIQGTTGAAEADLEVVRSTVRATLSFGGIMTVVSAVLFPVVWSE